LTPNTTYYARAYATNSVGTAYGNELTFFTLDYNRINLCQSACLGADGSNHTTRSHNICYTTPMNPGDSYCLCLYIPLGLSGSLLGSGSFASAGVQSTVNGLLCFACVANVACCNASLAYTVNYGDLISIPQFTCATT
jgi:hypothetical protein